MKPNLGPCHWKGYQTTEADRSGSSRPPPSVLQMYAVNSNVVIIVQLDAFICLTSILTFFQGAQGGYITTDLFMGNRLANIYQ